MVKPRSPRPTVQCVDTYCQLYKDLFIEGRAYESFKYLQLGLISDLKRKSLPALAKAIGKTNAQGLLDAVALCWKPTSHKGLGASLRPPGGASPRCITTSFY